MTNLSLIIINYGQNKPVFKFRIKLKMDIKFNTIISLFGVYISLINDNFAVKLTSIYVL